MEILVTKWIRFEAFTFVSMPTKSIRLTTEPKRYKLSSKQAAATLKRWKA